MITDTGIRTDWAGKPCLLHWIAIRTDYARSMGDWCLDNFGIDSFTNWFYTERRFYFSNMEQATLFILRWS